MELTFLIDVAETYWRDKKEDKKETGTGDFNGQEI